MSPDKGSTLGKFLTYALTRGQDKMAPLGYSPLPPNLVQHGFDVIRQIAGAPDPDPLGDWGQQYLSLDTGEVQYPAAHDHGIISLTSGGATQLDQAFATAASVPMFPRDGLPADADRFQCVALVRPTTALGADQARQLRRYVIQGGTLPYVTGEPDPATFNQLAEALGIATRRGTGTVSLATTRVVGTNRATIGLASRSQPVEFTPILASGTAEPVLSAPVGGGNVLVAEDLGAGRVVTSGTDAIFGSGSGDAVLPRNLCGSPHALVCDGPGGVIRAVEGVPTVGPSGDDVIIGTPGADTIDGGGGNDVICSVAGDDVVTGGDGDDRIDGGVGDDSIAGGLARISCSEVRAGTISTVAPSGTIWSAGWAATSWSEPRRPIGSKDQMGPTACMGTKATTRWSAAEARTASTVASRSTPSSSSLLRPRRARP